MNKPNAADIHFKMDAGVERGLVLYRSRQPKNSRLNGREAGAQVTWTRELWRRQHSLAIFQSNVQPELDDFWFEPNAGFRYTIADFGKNAGELGLKDGQVLRLQGRANPSWV